MAFDAGEATGELKLDAKQFLAELKKLGVSIDKMGKEAKQSREQTESFGSSLKKIAVGIGAAVVGFVALRAAIRGFNSLISESTREAAAFETVVDKLTISLKQAAGGQGVQSAVEGLKEYASELQRTTKFSDGAILSVAQTLTVLGVQEKNLKQSTKAVLDYSAAMGRDAVESAKQFGKTLSGMLGELAEAFPALKSLGAEALIAGGAFTFAEKSVGGFSEALANSTEGIAARLQNTIDDFQKQVGALLNPFINTLKLGGIAAVEELTALVEENRTDVIALFKDFALSAIDGIEIALTALENLRLGFQEVKFTAKTVGAAILGTWQEFRLSIAESRLEYARFNQEQGIAVKGMGEIEANVKRLQGDVAETADAFGKIRRETDEAKANIRRQAEVLRSKLLPVLKAARGAVNAIADDFATGDRAAADLGSSVGGAASNTEALATAAIEARQALAAAAREAAGLENATGGAARNVGAIRNGDGGGGGAAAAGSASGGDAFGRREGGGGVGLGDDVFSSIATLGSLERRLVKAGGRTGADQASAFVGNVRADVQGQIDRALSEFTSNLINELNRAGITDPTARSQFINQRVAEAERLGIIPDSDAAAAFAGGSFS